MFAACGGTEVTPDATYTITFTDDGNGTAEATVGGTKVAAAMKGAMVAITATPNEYVFDKWSAASDGVTFGDASAATTTFTMPGGDVTIGAEFKAGENPDEKYTITLTPATGGTITATIDGEEVIEAGAGATVTLTATLLDGYLFGEWTTASAGVTFGSASSATTTFTMPEDDVVIGVEFAEDTSFDVMAAITDPTFKEWCRSAMNTEYQCFDRYMQTYTHPIWDTNRDGKLSIVEASNINSIHLFISATKSAAGLEYFTGLEVFYCLGGDLASLDVSHNTALKSLYCPSTKITSLDVSNNIELVGLWCDNSKLTSLTMGANTALTRLVCGNNQLTSLDVTGCTALSELRCYGNQLTSIDLSQNRSLSELSCYGNQFASLDVSATESLALLNCNGNKLTSIVGLTANKSLQYFACYNNLLTSLDVSQNRILADFYCYGNRMSALDISAISASFNVLCGLQRTADGTADQTLSLTMRANQKPLWDANMSANPQNQNVILAN